MENLKSKGWKEENNKLIKDFKFNNFLTAIDFVNKIATIAESLNHHPDILIYSYKNVRLTLTTHEKNKVTEKDIKLANKIENLI